MKTQYDNIAQEFDQTDRTIIKKYIIKPTFAYLCGELEDRKVLDLGCGTGDSTRLLKESLDSRNVKGLDISNAEIDIARQRESAQPLGIEYYVGDASKFNAHEIGGPFEVITAMFLLHYSSSKNELEMMCKNIFDSLTPDGIFVTINPNPDVPIITTKRYEMTSTMEEPFKEGTKRKITYYLSNKELCSFENYYWSKKTYITALRSAGFKKIEWISPIVSEEGINKYGKEFWNEYLDNPHAIGIICSK